MTNTKKLIILYVYDALKYGSSEKCLLHQTKIAKQISQFCGIQCNRKTIARNINYLRIKIYKHFVKYKGDINGKY